MEAKSFWGKIRSFRLLPPRESEFYILIDEMSRILVEAAGGLIDLFNASGDHVSEIGVRLENCKTRCTQIADSVENLLKVAQQPPFDRSELSQFAASVIRVLKFMNHASNRYIVYEIPSSDKEMREMAAIIKEAVEHIDAAVRKLHGKRDVDPHCRAVEHLEIKADAVYHGGLRRRVHEIRTHGARLKSELSATPPDAPTTRILAIADANVEYTRHVAVFFILRQVYAELERSIDACSDLATTLRRMVASNV